MKTLWLLPAVLLIAACSSAPKQDPDAQPDWVDGNSQQHPSERYLTGVGSADDLNSARDRARADLSKVFQVAINARSSDTQQSTRDASGTEFREQVARFIDTETRQIIQGIEIADSWANKQGRHYALAVLNRQTTAARLRQRSQQLDSETQTWIEKSRAATDPLQQIHYASRSIELQLKRQALQQQLQIVDLTGRGLKPKWTIAELESQWKTLLGRLNIRVAAKPATFAPQVEAALSELGVNINDQGYSLRAAKATRSLGKNDGWFIREGLIKLELVNSQGTVVARQDYKGRESATKDELAESRLNKNMDAEVNKLVPLLFIQENKTP